MARAPQSDARTRDDDRGDGAPATPDDAPRADSDATSAGDDALDLPIDVAHARGEAAAGRLAALGAALRRLGLREPAVRACFHLTDVAYLPFRMLAMARREPVLTPAAVAPWLLVAGRALPLDVVSRVLGDTLDALSALGVVDVAEGAARARVAVVPIGESLLVCDRLDAPPSRELVTFPDESAFHLIASLPRRRVGRWLDVGTGCGVIPLAARGRAVRVLGTDINPRAIAMAQLGAWLSGAGHIAFRQADLLSGAGDEPWDLITFNAPIPAEVVHSPDDPGAARMLAGPDAPLYYHSPAGERLLDRFWAGVRSAAAPGGEILVHSWQPARGYPASLGLRGRVAAACYTPDREPGYGITSWRPDGSDQVTSTTHALTGQRRFVTRDWGLDD